MLSGNPSELLARAMRAQAEGKLDEAGAFARQVVELDPSNLQATLILGVIEFKSMQFVEAGVHLEEVARRDPASFHARMLLSLVYREQARSRDAVVFARQAIKLSPNDSAAHGQLGFCLLDLGQYSDALEAFVGATKLAPRNALTCEGLGRALRGMGNLPAAIGAFRESIAIDPNSESAAIGLTEALLDALDYESSEECARRFVERFPKSAAVRSLLSRVLMDQDRGAEALEHAKSAVDLDRSDASIATAYGSVLQNLGRIDEATTMFERSIAINSDQGYAYFAVAYNRKLGPDDAPLVRAMEQMAAESNLTLGELNHLEYALGKAHQDLGAYELAMTHFDKANRIAYQSKFGARSYDRQSHVDGFEQIKAGLTLDFLRKHASCGVGADLPFFVVGMMRSGTTLVEQILSSHSEVGAAGEQKFWMDRRAEAFKSRNRNNSMERDLDETAVTRLAETYVSMLRHIAPGRGHVVDKMPANYSILGLIHLALPNAKIIHVRRHPVDTCLSIYTTPNRSRIGWCHDKGNIVFAYRQYEQLMEHWNASLPQGRVLEVRYEDLVLNREQTTREMIRFCGLRWEDACLAPERNARGVRTPSVWQVRQPVYTSSLERWRAYEPWLGEFAELL
jgi:tetratricopeptide (TPR) repeat protein